MTKAIFSPYLPDTEAEWELSIEKRNKYISELQEDGYIPQKAPPAPENYHLSDIGYQMKFEFGGSNGISDTDMRSIPKGVGSHLSEQASAEESSAPYANRFACHICGGVSVHHASCEYTGAVLHPTRNVDGRDARSSGRGDDTQPTLASDKQVGG